MPGALTIGHSLRLPPNRSEDNEHATSQHACSSGGHEMIRDYGPAVVPHYEAMDAQLQISAETTCVQKTRDRNMLPFNFTHFFRQFPESSHSNTLPRHARLDQHYRFSFILDGQRALDCISSSRKLLFRRCSVRCWCIHSQRSQSRGCRPACTFAQHSISLGIRMSYDRRLELSNELYESYQGLELAGFRLHYSKLPCVSDTRIECLTRLAGGRAFRSTGEIWDRPQWQRVFWGYQRAQILACYP